MKIIILGMHWATFYKKLVRHKYKYDIYIDKATNVFS
jgi:hypothetical protein